MPKYLQAEEINIGFFIVIVYTDNDIKRVKDIRERVKLVQQATGYEISVIVIDATSGLKIA